MMWRRSIGAIGMAAALGLGWTAPAGAQGDPAAQFRQVIDNAINEINLRTGGQVRAQTSRPIEVTMQGGAAVATLPDLALVGSGGSLTIGTLTVTQSQPAAGRLRYETQLPREMRAAGPNGGATIATSAGRFAMVLDASTSMMHEIDLHVENINVRPANRQGALTIDLIELTSAITSRPDGLSDAPGQFRVQNVRFQDSDSRQSLSIGEIVMAGGVLGFQLADMERMRAAIDEARRAAPAEQVRRTLDAFFGFAFGTLTTEVTATNVQYGDGGPTPAVTIGRATFTQTLTSLTQPEARYDFRYAQEGVQIRQGMMPYQQYMPSQVVVALSADKIPAQAFKRIFSEMMQSSPTGMPSLGPNTVDTLIAALVQSGATLRLAPIQWVSQAIGVTLNASLAANGQSPLRAVGNGELVIRGLDAVLRELGVDPAQQARPGQGGANSPASMAALLSALGQQGTGPDGQPTRTYRFELSPEGRLTLNGTDMSALLTLLGVSGPRPAQGPATPGQPTQPTPGGKPPTAGTPATPAPPAQPVPPAGGGKPPTGQAPPGGKPPQRTGK